MKYVIDGELANLIIDYLSRRPYIEVANLIQGLHLLKPAKIVDSPEEEEKKAE